MKRIAVCLDFDGCVSTTQYIWPFEPNQIGDIKENTSIIDINQELWNFIKEICAQNPDLEIFDLVHFSLRQDEIVDAGNSRDNQTESSFLAMQKFTAHLKKILPPHIKIVLHCELMGDIHRNYPSGHTLQRALSMIDYSFLGKGMIPFSWAMMKDMPFQDETKITFALAHTGGIPAEAFYYFDDKLSIHENMQKFYSSQFGSALIPVNTRIFGYHLDDGKLNRSHIYAVIGTGKRMHLYAELLREIARLESEFTKILPPHKTPEESAQLIHQIYQKISTQNQGRFFNKALIIEKKLYSQERYSPSNFY